MSSLHPDVERLALLGWHLYPCSSHSKAGMFKGAAEAATYDLDQLERWTGEFSGCNWRVVCGPSNLFALDVDRPGPTHDGDGFASLAALVEKHGPLPPRPMTRTGGSGGAVLFFKHKGEPLIGASGKVAPGLDPHRGKQVVVVPPSRHPETSGLYTWRVPPWEVAPPPIPGWLAKLFAPPPEPERPAAPRMPTERRAEKLLRRAVEQVASAPPGTANDTLYRRAHLLAGWAAQGLLSERDAVSALYNAAKLRSIPDREARATIRSGWTSGLRRPVEVNHA